MKKIALLLLLTLSTLSALAADPRQLTLTFPSQRLRIEGVTPGATVYVYSLAREPQPWTTNIVPRDTRLTDDDHNGVVVWNFEKSFPRRSVWFAVELGSGKYGASAPSDYPAQRVDLTSTQVSRNASGAIQQVTFAGSVIECIVVRSTNGSIWGSTVPAQTSNDRSTERGKVTIRMADLQPRSGTESAAPPELAAGDVLFILNSFNAQYGVAEGEI